MIVDYGTDGAAVNISGHMECEASYKQAYLGCIGLGGTGISLNLPAKMLLPVLFSETSMKCC